MSSFCLLRKCPSILQPVKDAAKCNVQLAGRTLYTIPNDTLEKQRHSPLNKNAEKPEAPKKELKPQQVLEYRDKLPEFLPNPLWRDRIREKLEMNDMFKRRKVIDIPEFYVGSIMAVTIADKYAQGKSSRFLGRCIDRSGVGMCHMFVLRNVIGKQGVEIMYELYNPLILKIEVLKLQKSPDDMMYYLRDCPLEYSYIPQEMLGEMIHSGMDVPVDKTKVKLGPRPWTQRWDRYNLKGVEEFTEWKSEMVKEKARKSREHPQNARPWEKVDIVKHYRESVNPVDAQELYSDVDKSQKSWKKREK